MGAFRARTLAGFAGVDVVAVADPNADNDNANANARDIGCIALTMAGTTVGPSALDGLVAQQVVAAILTSLTQGRFVDVCQQ